MEASHEIFIGKLDRFIRKYYQNQLLRGLLLVLILAFSYFIIISYSEYFLYFSVAVRTFIAIFSCAFLGLILFQFILRPLVALFNIGNRITYRQAIDIITNHFSDVQDGLLNTLELTELAKENQSKINTLLLASINQRIDSIQLISFRKAISFRTNIGFVKYLLIVLMAIVSGFIFVPDMYTESSNRLINFRQEFSPPADFKFIFDTSSLKAVRGSDFKLEVVTEGKYVPSEVYIYYGGNKFLLKKEGNHFSYVFRNINNSVSFFLKSGKFVSKSQQIRLLYKSEIESFMLLVNAPAYTQIQTKSEQSFGDISVPDGSVLEWTMATNDTSSIQLIVGDSLILMDLDKGTGFRFTNRVRQNTFYQICLVKDDFEDLSYAKYEIKIVPDLHPLINVISVQDSVLTSSYYFKGLIKDDYGFSRLRFCYLVNDEPPVYIPIAITKKLSTQEFYFAFDFSSVDVSDGSQIRYYFEIFDNDAVNSPKMTRSFQTELLIPDLKEMYDFTTSIQDSVTSYIEKGMELSQSIQNDIKRMQKNILDSRSDKWQQHELFQEIQNKKKNLDELLQQINKDNKKKTQINNSKGRQDSLLLEKQKQIDHLLKNVMDDELEKLLEEFNKLANNFKVEDVNRLGNKIKMSFDDFQKQMDRNLKLLERYDIELNANKLIKRLNDLADHQDEISTLGNKEVEKMKSQQVKDHNKWNEIEKDFSNLFEKNSRIKDPYHFEDSSINFMQISNKMKETENLLENGNISKGTKNMRATSKIQKILSQNLKNSLSKSVSGQLSIDIENLLRIMNNLIDFSFQFEKQLTASKKIEHRNPLFVKMLEKQAVLKDEYLLIQDSLLSLSAHSPQVALLIGDRIFRISDYLDKISDLANERRTVQATIVQQKTLGEVNELALFLSEAVKQLLNQMANAMPGDQIGDKKATKPSFAGMKSEQESLKKMLEKMIQEMEEGNSMPRSKEKLGRFLQKQDLFQQRVREMLQKGEMGVNTEKILREILKLIDETQVEVSNFSINSNTINRQNKIISRLLKADNSHHENDFDRKRKSKSVNYLKMGNPTEIFEYKRIRTDFEDVFNDSYVKMFDFYDKLYLDYMIHVNND